MANPQLSNGYTQIANEIMEALYQVNLSPYESRIVWYIFRKTYGFRKKIDRISLSQFVKDIRIDRRLVHRTLKKLSKKNMITPYRDKTKHVSYEFQKDYEKWNTNNVTHIDDKNKESVTSLDDTSSVSTDDKVVSLQTPTKETIQKKTYSLNSYEVRMAELLFSLIKKRNPGHKKPDIQEWARHIDLMIRVDGRKVDDIEKLIKWTQEDDFWQNNILSTASLRKKYDTLWLKAGLNGKKKRFDEIGFTACQQEATH